MRKPTPRATMPRRPRLPRARQSRIFHAFHRQESRDGVSRNIILTRKRRRLFRRDVLFHDDVPTKPFCSPLAARDCHRPSISRAMLHFCRRRPAAAGRYFRHARGARLRRAGRIISGDLPPIIGRFAILRRAAGTFSHTCKAARLSLPARLRAECDFGASARPQFYSGLAARRFSLDAARLITMPWRRTGSPRISLCGVGRVSSISSACAR